MITNAPHSTTTGEASRFTRFDRRLLTAPVAIVAAAFLAQAALAGPPPPVVRGTIQAPAGNKVFLVGHGVGFQMYACNGTAWSFVAPRADLFADNGQLIVTHFAGPSWQARDGSTVVGMLVDKVTVDPTAIPWLLLSASPAPDSHGGGSGTRPSSSGSTRRAVSPRPRPSAPQRPQAPRRRSRTPPTTSSGSRRTPELQREGEGPLFPARLLAVDPPAKQNHSQSATSPPRTPTHVARVIGSRPGGGLHGSPPLPLEAAAHRVSRCCLLGRDPGYVSGNPPTRVPGPATAHRSATIRPATLGTEDPMAQAATSCTEPHQEATN